MLRREHSRNVIGAANPHPTAFMAADASLTSLPVFAFSSEWPTMCFKATCHDVQRSLLKPLHSRLTNSGPGFATLPSKDFSSWQRLQIIGPAYTNHIAAAWIAISGARSCCSSASRTVQMQKSEKSEACNFRLRLAAVSVAVQAFRLIQASWCFWSLSEPAAIQNQR